MRYIGIDYGSRKLGIALSDENGQFAFPHSVVPRADALPIILKLCSERQVGSIVIGESNNLAGEANRVQKAIDKFASGLREKTKLPVILEPEFYTSAEAARIQGENAMQDASAAALILKSYLDKQKNHDDKH